MLSIINVQTTGKQKISCGKRSENLEEYYEKEVHIQNINYIINIPTVFTLRK